MLREHAEQEAELRLAKELAVDQARKRELEQAARKLQSEQQSERGSAGALSPSDLIAHQAYKERLEREKKLAAMRAERQKDVVKVRRSELETASIEHTLLARIKENRRKQHRKEEERAETDTLGEIAVQSFGRKTRVA